MSSDAPRDPGLATLLRSAASVREYYREAIQRELESEEGLFQPPSEFFIDALRRLPSTPGLGVPRALDAGFGNAQYALVLAERGFNVDCVDVAVSERVRGRLRQSEHAARLNIHESTLEDFQASAQYVVVVAKDVLHFCSSDFVAWWIGRLSSEAPSTALHYVVVFSDIDRRDEAGAPVRIEGEARLSREQWNEIVERSYRDGWSLDVRWTRHEQRSAASRHLYFTAWRCELVAQRCAERP